MAKPLICTGSYLETNGRRHYQLFFNFLRACFVTNRNLKCDVTRQAVISENGVTIDHENFSEIFFQSLQSNLNSCETYDLISNNSFYLNNNNAHLIIHINICSLQSYFQNLTQFLQCMKSPPSIILLSETRINVEPHTSIDIPGYTFVHFPSPTTVGGVGAYFSNFVNYTKIKTLKMQIRGCEDLWFEVCIHLMKNYKL